MKIKYKSTNQALSCLYRCALVLTGLLFISTVAMAQPPSPPATPIDGGLSLLLAAGGIYGAKKLRDHRKRNQ